MYAKINWVVHLPSTWNSSIMKSVDRGHELVKMLDVHHLAGSYQIFIYVMVLNCIHGNTLASTIISEKSSKSNEQEHACSVEHINVLPFIYEQVFSTLPPENLWITCSCTFHNSVYFSHINANSLQPTATLPCSYLFFQNIMWTSTHPHQFSSLVAMELKVWLMHHFNFLGLKHPWPH